MTLELGIQRLQNALNFIGSDLTTGKCSAKTWLEFFIVLFVSVNATIYTIDEWDDIERRLVGFKAALLHWFCLSYVLVIMFNSDMLYVLKTLENTHFEVPFPVSTRRQELMDSIHNNVSQASTFWYYSFLSCAIGGSTFPVIYLMIILLKENVMDIDIHNLLLLNPFWYPSGYDTFLGYCFAYFIQTVFLITVTHFGYYSVAGPMLSMMVIGGELQLLKLSIEEMDDYIYVNKVGTGFNTNPNAKYLDKNHNMILFVRYFVKHHQSIYRKVEELTKAIKLFAIFVHITVSLFVCMSIYYAVNKMSDSLSQVENALICGNMIGQVFIYDYMGEFIATNNEKLRRALYESSWIEKPKWFRKCLNIIMIRESKPIEMKMGGFMELNLKQFSLCINGCYSYYNLINKLK